VTATYTVKVSKTATTTTYTIVLPAGVTNDYAVLLLPPVTGADPEAPAKTWDEL
jgi:hypothetical protein